jgi:uncharacterized protein YbaP (TraB family)
VSAIIPIGPSPVALPVSEPKPNIPKFVERVLRILEALSKYLARGSDEIGMTYEITSPQGVKSYLIGTAHMVDRESIQKSGFQRIIAKCSRLYTEAGNDVCIINPYTGLLETEESYKHLPFHYFLDTAITLEAQYRKIPVYALDTGIVCVEKMMDVALNGAKEMGPEAHQKIMMKTLEELFENTSLLTVIKDWKARDVKAMAAVRDSMEYQLIALREDRWMDILLPLSVEKPICVAVGSGHIVGYDSLTERFKNEGFKVEPITRSPPGFLERQIRKVETAIRSRYV